MLLERHKQHLARFHISDEMLAAARVKSVNDLEARDLLGTNARFEDSLDGIYFPYLSPVTHEHTGGRLRLDHKTTDDAKYLSEVACRHLFFAPTATEALQDNNVPLVIVEAEKSALALASYAQRIKQKLLVVAIGGCNGWRRQRGTKEQPDGKREPESGPSIDFDLIKLASRTVAIIFDSNASSNKKVQVARDALAREMVSRNAVVVIADVPDRANVNGPDDLIAEFGDEALTKIFREAKGYSAQIVQITDMSDTVLDGKLGEFYTKHMRERFPVSYAWPALVTVASALVPRRDEKQRLNLYTALVGPVHSGKTQAIDAAQQLLGVEPPVLMDVMAGSAES